MSTKPPKVMPRAGNSGIRVGSAVMAMAGATTNSRQGR